jgi:hypothetical protein
MSRYNDKLNDALLKTIVEEYKNDIPFPTISTRSPSVTK